MFVVTLVGGMGWHSFDVGVEAILGLALAKFAEFAKLTWTLLVMDYLIYVWLSYAEMKKEVAIQIERRIQ